MTSRRFRSPMKAFVALLSFVCFLSFGPGAISGALAAEPTLLAADAPAGSSTWETWPKKPEGAGKAGEAGGTKTSSGISAGTWGWIAGGAAAVILIGVAASGSSSSSSTSPPVCNQ